MNSIAKCRIRHTPRRPWLYSGVVLSFLLAGCTATISNYDSVSNKNAMDLKTESLILIQKSTDPADKHTSEISQVRSDIQKALEYETGKGKTNNLTIRQWQILSDPNENLLAGFLNKWEAQNKGFSQTFVDDFSKNISDSFDEIIRLEQHKNR